MNKKTFFHILVLIILPLPLFGYLDPGSGSMLFSAVIGIVATLFFVIKGIFFKIIDIPAYISGVSRHKKTQHNIVFYSEGPQYWNVFLPVIRELSSRNIKCTYLSSKENDPGLSCGFPNVETKFIGEGNKAFFHLNTLTADICVMTTPGLDVLQIKRSKGVKKYVHITHSSGGMAGYATYGVDYFDVVLTGGDGDIKMIRELEKARNLPEKLLIPVGCTYLDAMRERLEKAEPLKLFDDSEKKVILLSPTWGKTSLLSKFGEKLIDKIIGAGYNLVIRPHPQSYISDKEIIFNLKSKYKESVSLKWDSAPDGLLTMLEADLMISDFSGIIFDFIFLFKKPVLSFTGNYEKRGKEAHDVQNPWVLYAVDLFKLEINEEDMNNIKTIIDAKLEKPNIDEETMIIARNDTDKFPNESGRKSADAIEFILNSVSR
jgi:hypothetical protein